jgi:hypothetical protein
MAGFLFLLGVHVLVRFSFRRHVEDSWVGAKPLPWFALVPLGASLGFLFSLGSKAADRRAEDRSRAKTIVDAAGLASSPTPRSA